ncbi:hypothetical protein [Synechococcus sp. CS-1328]|uniref:hypothetical protein n=1 Tax=Synechococcus sp. CS-1328 TaxID=2847976 RepID=UPI00223C24C0|nr:hypothetical protein [Synechococcus sp. CS-1328]
MTYCVGFLLDSGLVFASDSRTNAGVDYISTYSKMHVFQPSEDRLFVLLAAGNLATTQAVLNRIHRDLLAKGVSSPPGVGSGPAVGTGISLMQQPSEPPQETKVFADSCIISPEAMAGSSAPAAGPLAARAADFAAVTSSVKAGSSSARAAADREALDREALDREGVDRQAVGLRDQSLPDLLSARFLFEAADYVGRVSVAVQQEYGHTLRQSGASAEASFILGGQIRGDRHGLYLIYPQGNAVMATRETPFLQIGESKYGKPPLDFVGHCGLSLEDAARLCLISQIITRRSNLTVGPPFEVALMPRDQLRISRRIKLSKGAPEIGRSMEIWARSMQDGLRRLPRFAWEEDPL